MDSINAQRFLDVYRPRIKHAQLDYSSFSTAIIATKMFLASPAVTAPLSGLKPALWANAQHRLHI